MRSVGRRAWMRACAVTLLMSADRGEVAVTRPLAVAFDGFAIFDSRPVLALANDLFHEKGQEFVDQWSTRQFEYTWLRSLTARYADFRRVTEDALTFAANAMAMDLSSYTRAQLMATYWNMTCWPEVPEVLRALKATGLRLVLLSNMTPAMLESGIQASGLAGVFDTVLSTDRVRRYKPAPQAYALGVNVLRLPKQKILFVASAGWDAFGAGAFGYPVYWVNRQARVPEELDMIPFGVGASLLDLRDWIA